MGNSMKISNVQMFWLMASMEIGMTLLLTISPAIRDAKQDAWISMLVAAGVALLITFIVTRLSLLYPNQTLIQFSQTILGKWLGKAIVIPFLVMWYTVLGIVLRQSSDFIHLVLFRRTPLWAVIILALILLVYTTYLGGIEGVGRCSEFLGPIIVLGLTAVLVLCYQNMHWTRMLPVYQDSGGIAILKGAVSPISFLGESVMISMLVAFMSKPQDVLPRVMWAVGLTCAFLLASTLGVILTFGSLASKMWYPFFDMARYVSVMEFIQNIDSVIVVVWLCSVFIKLSLYMFITSYGTAQWLGVKNWRKLVWFVSPIVLILALLPENVDMSSTDYPTKFWVPYVLPVNIVGIPLLLWIVGAIRKKRTQ